MYCDDKFRMWKKRRLHAENKTIFTLEIEPRDKIQEQRCTIIKNIFIPTWKRSISVTL